MSWEAVGRYVQRAASGEQICACRVSDGWRYAAWSAPAEPELSYWDWHDMHAQERTRRGGAVAQRVTCIGVYETAEQARAACERATAAEKAWEE